MDTLALFKGSTALITGASSGIGMGFARILASYGIHLVITARSEQSLQHLAAELKAKYEVEIDVLVLDLTLAGAAQKLFNDIQHLNKSIDILINNAGFGKWANFLNESLESYHDMLNLNIHALVDLSYLFLPAMLARKKGVVINLASTAAFQPLPYIAIYAASKSFVLNFTDALAGEYSGQGIKFLALCPGNTTTNFAQTANADTTGMSASTVQEVVQAAIQALDQNKLYCVPGINNYLTAQLSRILPRSMMVKLTSNMLKKRVKV
ncbi:SDR family oxidoreductase [Acinetobacter qingfengensis]|uniref:NADP-dependent 3-hydroxy acid dehydrogenase YdfG n=1 Tax=Acinetobacter qingfengensis TaxID=1262585 RepID=A0A1E7QXE2_9GAMM|nr:SDR family oxidoreductase [Acinetobacter qingfengensis]KAA8731616.1 SDR family oxidoreductase [Acinetobacter qingfengensis]OEY91719.1 short-chain dehydrogenase [Acinetobacter qingfengensis]